MTNIPLRSITFPGLGNKYTVNANPLALSTNDRTAIPKDSDMDNYTTVGNYKVTTAAIARTIANIPSQTPGSLFVMSGSESVRLYQIYFAQPTTGIGIFAREKLSTSAWTDWIELTYRYTFDNAPTDGSTNPVTSDGIFDALAMHFALSSANRIEIPANSDLNNYTTPGNYSVRNSTTAQSITNCPSVVGGMLTVMTSSATSAIVQIYISASTTFGATMFLRGKPGASSSWGDWFQLNKKYDAEPTSGSSNLITSGNIYNALEAKADVAELAPAYSNTATYKIGDICAYNGTIYKCSVEITTAEEWTEEHWEVTNITDNLSDISEYVNSTYVSDIPQTDYSGTTRQSENGELKLYGTATAQRHLLFLNGQDMIAVTTTSFRKTLDAGTYLFDFHIHGHRDAGTLRGTYDKFNDPFTIVTGSERTAIYTFTQPVMIGLFIAVGNDYGTESDPTYVTVDAYKLTAKDDVIRARVPDAPTADGTYTLRCTVSDGVPTYSWVTQ